MARFVIYSRRFRLFVASAFAVKYRLVSSVLLVISTKLPFSSSICLLLFLVLPIQIFAMAQHSEDEITPAMPNKPAAEVEHNSEARTTNSAGVVRKEPDVGDILVFKMIPSAWIFAAYKTQFTDCWHFRRFETLFSDWHIASVYDRKGVKRHTDIGSWKRRWYFLHMCCASYVYP